MSNISVIIVSWNVRWLLRKCLSSVISEKPREIIVIDNNSSDGSAQMVKQEFPMVTLLAQTSNIGFARAANVGINKSSGDILLLLNPDASIKLHSLTAAEDFFIEHPQAGIMGGKILESNGQVQPSVRCLPSLWSQLVVLLKLGYLLPILLNKYLMKSFNYQSGSQVEQVSGAFFFIRRSVIKEIGIFNEIFWLWFEEVDYCARAVEADWQIWYWPQVEAKHTGGAGFSQLSHLARQRQFNKSVLHYFKIHGRFYAQGMLWLTSKISLIQAAILDLVSKFSHD